MPSQTVLIVEDEALIAMDLEQAILDIGMVPAVATNLEAALTIAVDQDIAFALLDFRVGDTDTTPVAEILRRRRSPFALCSGSQLPLVHGVFRGAPSLPKPYLRAALLQTIEGLNG